MVALALSAVTAAHCLHLIVSPAELGTEILTSWNPELVRLVVRERVCWPGAIAVSCCQPSLVSLARSRRGEANAIDQVGTLELERKGVKTLNCGRN